MKQRLKKALPIVCCICISSMMVCGYIPPQDRKYLDYFLKLYAAQLFRDKNFVLVSSSCYVGKKNIERVEMEFSFYRPMGKLKSREVIVDLAENLLEAINNDPILKRRGLLDVPFTSDRLIIEVKTDNIFSANADVETIKRIRLKKNTITYDTYPWSDLLTAGSNTFTEDYCVARMMCGKPVSYNDYENRHTYYKNFKNPDTPEGYITNEPDVVLPQLATVSAIDALAVPAEPFNSSLGNIEWVDYYSPFDTRSIENSLGEPSKVETEAVAPQIAKPLTKERNKHLNAPINKPQQDMLIDATKVLNEIFPPQNKPSNLRQRTQDGSQALIKDGATSTQSYNSAEPQSKLLPISSSSFIADSSDVCDPEITSRQSLEEGCEPFFNDNAYLKNAESWNGENSRLDVCVSSTRSFGWQECSELEVPGSDSQRMKLELHQSALNHLDNTQPDEVNGAAKSIAISTFSPSQEIGALNRESGWVESRSFEPKCLENAYKDGITGTYFYAANPQKQIESIQQDQFPESSEYQSALRVPSTPAKSMCICFHESDALVAQQDSSEAADSKSMHEDQQDGLDEPFAHEIPFETPSIVPSTTFPEIALSEAPLEEPDLSEEEKVSLLAEANIHADALKRYAMNTTGQSSSSVESKSENGSFVCQIETALQADQMASENENDKEGSFFEKLKQFFFRPYGAESNPATDHDVPCIDVSDDAKSLIIEKQAYSQPIELEGTNPPEQEDDLKGDDLKDSLESSSKDESSDINDSLLMEESQSISQNQVSSYEVSPCSNALWHSQSPSLLAYISSQNDSQSQEMGSSDLSADNDHENRDSVNPRNNESDLKPQSLTQECPVLLQTRLVSTDLMGSESEFGQNLVCVVDPDIVPLDSTLLPSETIEDVSPGMMQLDPEQKSALENTGAAQQSESSGMFSE